MNCKFLGIQHFESIDKAREQDKHDKNQPTTGPFGTKTNNIIMESKTKAWPDQII